MKKICYILVIMLLINLVPYNSFADDDEICDKVFEKGQFIELYTSIYDGAIDILNSSIDNTKKEEKLKNLFNNYKLDGEHISSRMVFININSSNNEERLANMITKELINTIVMNIEDLYYEDKNLMNEIDKIDALLKFYKLDNEISKYEIVKLNSKFSSVDIYRVLSNIIEEYNVKKQLALSINNVVQKIGNSKESTHIKTILDEYLTAQELDGFIDSDDLVKLIKRTKDEDKRVKLLFDKIIMMKNEQYFKERAENIADEIIEAIDYNKYHDCADSIRSLLRNNDIGYSLDLDEAVTNIERYIDKGYKTKEEAIQSEIFSKLRFSYSKEEINSILDEMVSILESEVENDYKKMGEKYDDEIYEEFLDIVYDYRISDIKQYVVPVDIAYAYYNYEELGYETAFRSTVDHLRNVLKKSELDEEILKAIKESEYDLSAILKGVTIALDNDDEYKEYLNTKKIGEVINSKPDNMDITIIDLILDCIIDSKKKDIVRFVNRMDSLDAKTHTKVIEIADIITDNGLDYLVDESEVIDIYMEHNDQNSNLKKELYDELFKKLGPSKPNMENVIKNSIKNIIDTVGLINDKDLEYIINKGLSKNGLNTYVIQNDIKNAYFYPLKYGYSDRKSGIAQILKNGMNEKIFSEIRNIFNKDLNESDTEKEIRIILKRNYLDSNMSFTEIKEKYLKQD